MVNDIIKIRHKSFLACPCCDKPIKLKYRFLDKEIYIEPIHAYKCSECGIEGIKLDIFATLNPDNPTKDARIVCRQCHNKLHRKKVKLWNKRGKKPEELNDFVKRRLQEMGLD